jgi:hypothetical protein
MSDKKTKDYEKLYREYENLYWKELEENIELHDEIDKLKWKIRILESKIKRLEL